MALKIDLFMPQKSLYAVLQHFTRKLYESLERNHIDCRILVLDSQNPRAFLEAIVERRPDCTLTFNPVFPDDQGNFLCDMMKIPHVSYHVDSPNTFFFHLKDPLKAMDRTAHNIFCCVDREAVLFFLEMGFSRVFFLPHAVEKEAFSPVDRERPFEVSMLMSGIVPQDFQKVWREEFPTKTIAALEEATKLILENRYFSYLRAFADAYGLLNKDRSLSKDIVNFGKELGFLERYLRGLDRSNCLNSITHAEVNLFGRGDKEEWKRVTRESKNVTVYPEVTFPEALRVMANSKIVVNSCSWIRDGAHERIFSAMAAGALVITTRTPYLEEIFKEGEDLLFYDLGQWDRINDQVAYYLSHESDRNRIALQGQQKVLKEHTWDNRAAEMISKLPPLLNTIAG